MWYSPFNTGAGLAMGIRGGAEMTSFEFRFIPLRISAMFALGAWILTQLVMLLIPNVGPVAWWAHIGGIFAGALLLPIMRRPGVELFGRKPESAA